MRLVTDYKKQKKGLVKSFVSNFFKEFVTSGTNLLALIKCLIIKSKSLCPDSFHSTQWNEVGKAGICGKLGVAFT